MLHSLWNFATKVRDVMTIPADKPELIKAQYLAMTRQIPLLFVILMTNTWTLAATHLSYAPIWLTIVVPVFMAAVSASSIMGWWRLRDRVPSADRAYRALNNTFRLSIFISVGFAIWALLLYGYGTAYTKAHIAFYIATTVVSCIFCMMHLRPAALSIAAIINGGFILFFMASGEPTFVASALNVALVSLALLVILNINYVTFTELVEAEANAVALSNENSRLANLDSLTDLPNRRAFFAHLDQAFADIRNKGRDLSVGIVDLDGFKPVNDAYGHTVGDKVLQEVSRRLDAICRTHGIYVARLGGDEFSLIFQGAFTLSDLNRHGQAICDALAAPFVVSGITVQIGGSIGLARYSDTVHTPAELMNRADYALYQGKRHQRGSVTVFSEDHSTRLNREALVEQVLRRADLAKELRVVFQPIVDVQNKATIGFEALARWHSPELGHVSPGEFIPVAERAGVVSRLTTELLRKALVTAATWPKGMRMSFNLSAQDLSSSANLLRITHLIMESGFNPRLIDLEVTETAFSFDPAQVKKSVDMLRQLGCGISIDDFGTGYSSLSRIHALPLTKMKIDRSFVTNISENTASYNIVKSLIALSKDMNLDCVVEGVETEEELRTLSKLGNIMVQGYYYSPPMEGEAVRQYLRREGEGTQVRV